MAPLLPPLLMRRAERARASPPTTTPASATRAATVAHDSPGGQGVCIDGGRLGHDRRCRGCREPEPIEQGGGVGGRQVADGHEVQGLGKVPECPS